MVKPNPKNFDINGYVARNEPTNGIHHYSFEQNLYINQLESENKDANQFIIDVANVFGIDADGVGFDGLQLSIDDFEEAKNKLDQEKKELINSYKGRNFDSFKKGFEAALDSLNCAFESIKNKQT